MNKQDIAKISAQELLTAADEFFAGADAWNLAHPDERRVPLLEELLQRLALTRAQWDVLREAEGGKRARETAQAVQRTEQRFTAAILQAAFANPRLITLAVYLTKQRCYGGYADRQGGTVLRPQQTLTVRLEGASEPFD